MELRSVEPGGDRVVSAPQAIVCRLDVRQLGFETDVAFREIPVWDDILTLGSVAPKRDTTTDYRHDH